MTQKLDAMDRAAGLSADSPLRSFRAFRPEFVEGSEACRLAVLTPEDDLGLSQDLRAAIARRVALGANNSTFLAEYPMPENPDFSDLATGKPVTDPALAALASHADMIAATPAKASAAHLAALQSAGYSVPQIIALSELLAYVCFQMRVAHGLRLLEGTL
ncbi:uncharacterized protein YciW [Pacificibacter maritimus]|uniref:Uncharacterized protein YciW n=1 Tax=Pacificibacter maritimus TaxID=762213 RepID=A0A3N4UQL5_9RHOB|nr:hypothetical protein [Pacificibacter maritimus]RPE70945.1 uncharacterized protein YciW [Pacificibacter maritimus]